MRADESKNGVIIYTGRVTEDVDLGAILTVLYNG